MDQEIKCGGDCFNCEYRQKGQTDPRECASIVGLMHTQQAIKDIRTAQEAIAKSHAEILESIQALQESGKSAAPVAALSLESGLIEGGSCSSEAAITEEPTPQPV